MAGKADETDSVLKFDEVTLMSGGTSAKTLWDVDIDLCRGELALVHLEAMMTSSLLADACVGLLYPTKGTVHFQGQAWATIAPDRASALRGTIGRVFDGQAWVSHLDMAENIMLSQLYHTTRPYDGIRKEAQRLAQTFGLPGLPRRAVDQMLPADLQRAACVRAFMGKPALIVLESPTRGLYPRIMGALVNNLRRQREHGTAVLWLTCDELVWRDQAVRPTQKYHMAGSQLVRIDG